MGDWFPVSLPTSAPVELLLGSYLWSTVDACCHLCLVLCVEPSPPMWEVCQLHCPHCQRGTQHLWPSPSGVSLGHWSEQKTATVFSRITDHEEGASREWQLRLRRKPTPEKRGVEGALMRPHVRPAVQLRGPAAAFHRASSALREIFFS